MECPTEVINLNQATISSRPLGTANKAIMQDLSMEAHPIEDYLPNSSLTANSTLVLIHLASSTTR